MILLVAAAACPLLGDLPASHWSAMSRAQTLFLEGVWAMSPETPPGLPDGDQAWIGVKGEDSAVVFTKGKNLEVCGPPMTAPKKLRDLIDEIAKGPGDDL